MCQLVAYQLNKCDIYRIKCFDLNNDLIDLTPQTNNQIVLYLNKKYDYCFELMNYWSFDNNLNDSIGKAHLTNKSTIVYSSDRFDKQNSSLLINAANPFISCYDLPNGTYIDSKFTITAWVVRGVKFLCLIL